MAKTSAVIAVLRLADRRGQLLGREALRVDVEVLEDAADQPLGVPVVIDRERGRDAQVRVLPAEDPGAGRVEREDPRCARATPLPINLDPGRHLARGLVRERDREDLERADALLTDQVAIRWVSARVLPLPAPATMSTGPSVCRTASRWISFSPSSNEGRRGHAQCEWLGRPSLVLRSGDARDGGSVSAGAPEAESGATFDRKLALLLAMAMFVLVVDASLMNVSSRPSSTISARPSAASSRRSPSRRSSPPRSS